MLLLLPILGADTLPTTDGPSHVYNAAVTDAVQRGRSPYVDYHVLGPAVAPNRATATLLLALHGWFGWRDAEKVVAAAIVLASFSAFLVLLAPGCSTRPICALCIVVAAWLSQNWFVWSGFYDFALSLALFAILNIGLARLNGASRLVSSLALLTALLLAHLFTFAIGAGFVVWTLLPDLGSRRTRGPAAVGIAASVGLVTAALRLGGTGAGAVEWTGKAKALAGVALGDVLLTFHPIGVVPGVLLMGVVCYGALTVVRRSLQERRLAWGDPSTAGAILLLLSLVCPETFREGSYIGARLRILCVICMLPALAVHLERIPRSHRRAAALVLAVALAIHGCILVGCSRRLSADLGAMESVLREAGARPGALVTSVFRDNERTCFRISAYLHLLDRVALEDGYVLVSNYEARLAIFRVKWGVDPGEVGILPKGDGWLVSLKRSSAGPRSVFVVHERDRTVLASDGCLVPGTRRSAGSFAVTELRHACD